MIGPETNEDRKLVIAIALWVAALEVLLFWLM